MFAKLVSSGSENELMDTVECYEVGLIPDPHTCIMSGYSPTIGGCYGGYEPSGVCFSGGVPYS